MTGKSGSAGLIKGDERMYLNTQNFGSKKIDEKKDFSATSSFDNALQSLSLSLCLSPSVYRREGSVQKSKV